MRVPTKPLSCLLLDPCFIRGQTTKTFSATDETRIEHGYDSHTDQIRCGTRVGSAASIQ